MVPVRLRRQRGFFVLIFVVFVAASAIGMVAAVTATMKSEGVIDRSLANMSEEARQAALLADASGRLRDWYEQNAWELDSAEGKPDVGQILTELEIDLKSVNAGFDVTPRLVSDGIGYHVFALWYDVPGATGTGLNQGSGDFMPGELDGIPAKTQYAVVSGLAIQVRKESETRRRMAKIVDALSNYSAYQSHGLLDPDGDMHTNWFRDTSCRIDSIALPCYDADTDARVTVLPTALGLDPETLVSAWSPNTSIFLNNADMSGPPYKFRVSAGTPWGTTIQMYALSD